jgi:hypothetical protein
VPTIQASAQHVDLTRPGFAFVDELGRSSHSHLGNLDNGPAIRSKRHCRLRRWSCTCICVPNAERLLRLMKVEPARATAITRKGCVKRVHRRNRARTKLSRPRRFADTADRRSMAPETRSLRRGWLQIGLEKTIILPLAQPIVRNLQCHMGVRSPVRSSIRVQSFRSRTERPNHC